MPNINLILAIETSCDETALALYHKQHGLIDHVIYSQIMLHQHYGGVVPELAARDHIKKLMPLLQQLLTKNNININQIQGIAYTKGPGLIGALLTGANFAKSLAWALKIPFIGIHHLEGHLLAPMLEKHQPSFPFLALLISGGHTLLATVTKFGEYNIIGQSLDDAIGEAFDKCAKLLGLPYPGGPHLEKLAKNLPDGTPKIYNFPRPMLHHNNLDFSFSGLKTYTLNTWNACKQANKNNININNTKAAIAYAFQEATADILYHKTKKALLKTKLTQLVVAGGVSANKFIRNKLDSLANQLKIQIFYPRLEFCTDNAAMIAYPGLIRLNNNEQSNFHDTVLPRWSLENI